VQENLRKENLPTQNIDLYCYYVIRYITYYTL